MAGCAVNEGPATWPTILPQTCAKSVMAAFSVMITLQPVLCLMILRDPDRRRTSIRYTLAGVSMWIDRVVSAAPKGVVALGGAVTIASGAAFFSLPSDYQIRETLSLDHPVNHALGVIDTALGGAYAIQFAFPLPVPDAPFSRENLNRSETCILRLKPPTKAIQSARSGTLQSGTAVAVCPTRKASPHSGKSSRKTSAANSFQQTVRGISAQPRPARFPPPNCWPAPSDCVRRSRQRPAVRTPNPSSASCITRQNEASRFSTT